MALSDEIRLLTMRLHREHTLEERHEYNLAIAQKFALHPKYQKAKTILFFMPGEDEADTRPLILQALLDKKTAALPKADAEKDGAYEARKIDSTYELETGPSGLSEPPAGAEKIPFESIDLVVVPGALFDFSGNRIGYVRGYCKEALLEAANAHLMGIAFEYQVMNESVVAAGHDAIVDEIFTERRDMMVAQSAERREKERLAYLEGKKKEADEAAAQTAKAEEQRIALEAANKVSEKD